jgi:hypothetical protein
MTNSSHIAKLVGPTLIALSITEWMNLDVFVGAMGPSFGPHVYLNGTLLFVAGLAIVRAHNSWTRGWPVLITLVGWFAMLAGLGRMAAPLSAQEAGRHPSVLYGSLVVLLVIGIVLTLKAYGPGEGQAAGGAVRRHPPETATS